MARTYHVGHLDTGGGIVPPPPLHPDFDARRREDPSSFVNSRKEEGLSLLHLCSSHFRCREEPSSLHAEFDTRRDDPFSIDADFDARRRGCPSSTFIHL